MNNLLSVVGFSTCLSFSSSLLVTPTTSLAFAWIRTFKIQLETETRSRASLNVNVPLNGFVLVQKCEHSVKCSWDDILCCFVVVTLQYLQSVRRLRDASRAWCECNDCTDTHITSYINHLMPHPVGIVYLYRFACQHNIPKSTLSSCDLYLVVEPNCCSLSEAKGFDYIRALIRFPLPQHASCQMGHLYEARFRGICFF